MMIRWILMAILLGTPALALAQQPDSPQVQLAQCQGTLLALQQALQTGVAGASNKAGDWAAQLARLQEQLASEKQGREAAEKERDVLKAQQPAEKKEP